MNASLCRLAVCLACYCLLPTLEVPAQDLPPVSGTPVAEFPIDDIDRWIIAPIRVNGAPKHFMLDSGSNFHVVDQSLESQLGEPMESSEVETPGGTIQGSVHAPPSISIGTSCLNGDQPVLCVDLSPLSQRLGYEIDGVLGTPFFLQHILYVDFDQRLVRVYEKAIAPNDTWGTKFSLELDQQRFVCLRDIGLGKDDTRFQIDTGKNGSFSLAARTYDELKSNGEITTVGSFLVGTASGDAFREYGRVDGVMVGPFRLPRVSVVRSKANVVGLGVLSRFKVLFDVSRKSLYLSPGKKFDEPGRCDRSGLYLTVVDRRIQVHYVDFNSPAYHARMWKGDVLLEFNGTEVAADRLSKIRRALCDESGTVHELTVRRGDETVAVRLSLVDPERWIHPEYHATSDED